MDTRQYFLTPSKREKVLYMLVRRKKAGSNVYYLSFPVGTRFLEGGFEALTHQSKGGLLFNILFSNVIGCKVNTFNLESSIRYRMTGKSMSRVVINKTRGKGGRKTGPSTLRVVLVPPFYERKSVIDHV